jgi:acyl carrier protein
MDAAIVTSAEGYMTDVLEEVTRIISKHSSLGVEALTAETRLDEIDIQSLDLVEIMFEIEERFKIEVPYNANTESEFEFRTIGQIAEGVRSILAKSTAS